jgi:hypothetical protein
MTIGRQRDDIGQQEQQGQQEVGQAAEKAAQEIGQGMKLTTKGASSTEVRKNYRNRFFKRTSFEKKERNRNPNLRPATPARTKPNTSNEPENPSQTTKFCGRN